MAQALCLGSACLLLLIFFFFSFFFGRILSLFWLSPATARRRLIHGGFDGPPPNFPLGNLMEMYEKTDVKSTSDSDAISHDIHSAVFPYFAKWRETYGKVFIYWLGTEPFLYVAEPEFLKKVSSGVLGKKWGKAEVFRNDRKPMFGKGLIMVDGDDWTHNRHIIAPAFFANNLHAMFGMMVDSTSAMLDNWSKLISTGIHAIDAEEHIVRNAAEIIARTSFGVTLANGSKVFEKLKSLQISLFRSNRLVGVPFSKILSPRRSYEAWMLGKEIDELLLEIISCRKEGSEAVNGGQDLLGLLLARNEGSEEVGGGGERRLSSRELVDECKTFFFGGHETTALALTWTLLLLGVYEEWQKVLREEIVEVSGGAPLNSDMLSKLDKMGWVWHEVLRLYSPAPNVQRQAKEEVVVGEVVVPKGTNMWIDVVGMHHDPTLWGDDVNEFKPERFKDSINGGCKHRMGFMPFGFGGRICIGRNLSLMEYKIVLSLILSKFSISVSPTYVHSPRIMLSLRPSQGVPLILHPLE